MIALLNMLLKMEKPIKLWIELSNFTITMLTINFQSVLRDSTGYTKWSDDERGRRSRRDHKHQFCVPNPQEVR